MMNVCMASALTIVKAKLISSTIQSRVPFLQFESLWTVICGMDIPFVNDTKTTHFGASKVQMKNKLEHEQKKKKRFGRDWRPKDLKNVSFNSMNITNFHHLIVYQALTQSLTNSVTRLKIIFQHLAIYITKNLPK